MCGPKRCEVEYRRCGIVIWLKAIFSRARPVYGYVVEVGARHSDRYSSGSVDCEVV